MIARSALACLSMVAVCLFNWPLAAQEQEYVETLDVNVVNIEVVVTDKQGQPVTGLTRDDFEIFEDGRKIELTNFYASGAAVDEPGVIDALAEEEMPGELGARETGPPRPGTGTRPAAGTQTLKLVVFVDHLNIGPQNRKLLFDQLRKHLRESIGPGSEVHGGGPRQPARDSGAVHRGSG